MALIRITHVYSEIKTLDVEIDDNLCNDAVNRLVEDYREEVMAQDLKIQKYLDWSYRDETPKQTKK